MFNLVHCHRIVRRLPLLQTVRLMSTSEEPLRLKILPKYVEKSFIKSSGPGGQNVNKVNTKVELRMNINKS